MYDYSQKVRKKWNLFQSHTTDLVWEAKWEESPLRRRSQYFDFNIGNETTNMKLTPSKT